MMISHSSSPSSSSLSQTQPPLKVLLVSLEFLGPVYSGNGTYARCIARGLVAFGGCQLMVVSASPPPNVLNSYKDTEDMMHAYGSPHSLLGVPIPTWGRLDRQSSWKEFAEGCAQQAVLDAIKQFSPHVVACVDWTGSFAWSQMSAAAAAAAAGSDDATTAAISSHPLSLHHLPSVYLNFRVFTTSTELHRSTVTATTKDKNDTHTTGEDEALMSDLAFYHSMEHIAVKTTAATVALCRLDALHLAAIGCNIDPNTGFPMRTSGTDVAASTSAVDTSSRAAAKKTNGGGDIHIVLPPLRGDIYKMASDMAGPASENKDECSVMGTGTILPPWPAALGPLVVSMAEETSTTSANNEETTPISLLANHGDGAMEGLSDRQFLVSAVRLSPEKGAQRFADLIHSLYQQQQQQQDQEEHEQESSTNSTTITTTKSLRQRKYKWYRALLCGSAPDAAYAANVRNSLLQVTAPIGTSARHHSSPPPPPLLVSSFLSPSDMAGIFSRARVNVHPALADAYGMTIIEAAAFGCPSLVHVPGRRRRDVDVDVGKQKTKQAEDDDDDDDDDDENEQAKYANQLFETVITDTTVKGRMKLSSEKVWDLVSSHVTRKAKGDNHEYNDETNGSSSSSSSNSSFPPAAAGSSSSLFIGSRLVELASHLPPVGACDLLGDAILAVDFTRPIHEVATRLSTWLFQEESEEEDGRSALNRVATAAQARALSWKEENNGAALACILREVAGR